MWLHDDASHEGLNHGAGGIAVAGSPCYGVSGYQRQRTKPYSEPGRGPRDSRQVFRSPLDVSWLVAGASAFGCDLSACPGLVLRVPPGSTPSTGSFPVVWVEVCLDFGACCSIPE